MPDIEKILKDRIKELEKEVFDLKRSLNIVYNMYLNTISPISLKKPEELL